MRFRAALVRNLFVVFGVMLLGSSEAAAQVSSVNFRVRFTGSVDCDRPIAVKNVPVTSETIGVVNSDGTASAELTQTAFVFSTTVRFDGRLGAPPASAPGGTSQVRVTGQRSLRLTWNLPNHAFVVNIAVAGQSCTARLESRLHAGKQEYSLFDGYNYHYCGKPRVASSSCDVR